MVRVSFILAVLKIERLGRMAVSSFNDLTWAVLILICPCCIAQVVTIRVIDADSKHPLQKQQVTVSLYDEGKNNPSNYEGDLAFTTDAKGEAHFALPEPVPGHLWVEIHLPQRKWWCPCQAFFATQELIQNGIVKSQHDERHPSPAIKAKLGEIIFAARKIPLWLQLLYPLYKE